MGTNDLIKHKRLPYFDVAKGILIICVVYSHICWATSTMCGMSVGYSWMCLNKIGTYLWVPFYMPAFFIITGYCSNFNKDFKEFLQNNVLTLIWPMLIITFQNHWFVYALIIAKLLFYGINKCFSDRAVIWLIYAAITISACLCQNSSFFSEHSRWYLFHGMALAIYIPIGQLLRIHIDKKWLILLSAVIYLGLICFAFTQNCNLPSVFSKYNVSLITLPLHLILSVTGSITLIGLCKRINKSKILEYLGKNSLVIFFVHMIFISTIVTHMPIDTNNPLHFICVLASSLILSCSVAAVLNTKYLKWCLGKFS